jgi:hypothetical protein
MAVDLNQIIQKVPRPILVVGVLILAIGLFVYNDPLRDECEVQSALFEKKTLGLLTAVRTKNKNKNIQFPQIKYWRDRCKEGNSIGSCNDYFDGLRSMTKELRSVSDKCQITYSEQNENFSQYLLEGLQIMALVAWGEKPPEGPANRLGWLSTVHLQTFCYMRRSFILISDEETFEALKVKVYREYPDDWPESLSAEDRLPENRPRALKSKINLEGSLKPEEVYSRSLFSVRCDLYM